MSDNQQSISVTEVMENLKHRHFVFQHSEMGAHDPVHTLTLRLCRNTFQDRIGGVRVHCMVILLSEKT